jgi:peptidylprolyl isomerase
MKHTVLILLMAASASAACAQTLAKPATSAASAAKSFASATTAKCPTASAAIKLPPGVPSVEGCLQTVFALRYQEIKIGDGAEAEPHKLYKVQYTYWLAANGQKIDSTYDHPGPPPRDKDGKLLLGADGKPISGPPLTVNFVQGRHAIIMGFDEGLAGMKIGGKRRLFIPWQMAWGAMGDPPAIPPEANMIYDVELVDVADLPVPPLPPSRLPGISDIRARRLTGASPNGTAPKPGMPASSPAQPAATAAPAAPAKP